MRKLNGDQFAAYARQQIAVAFADPGSPRAHRRRVFLRPAVALPGRAVVSTDPRPLPWPACVA
jgi:hypothetical protein